MMHTVFILIDDHHLHHKALGTREQVKLMIFYQKCMDSRWDFESIIMHSLNVLLTLSALLLQWIRHILWIQLFVKKYYLLSRSKNLRLWNEIAISYSGLFNLQIWVGWKEYLPTNSKYLGPPTLNSKFH